MSKNKKPAPENTQELAATNTSSEAPKKPESVVDVAFDALTAWAAKSLAATKRGLEAGARWLDGRAKVVGELATKLST